MKERGQRKMFSCQKHFSKNKLVQNDKKINNITDTNIILKKIVALLPNKYSAHLSP